MNTPEWPPALPPKRGKTLIECMLEEEERIATETLRRLSGYCDSPEEFMFVGRRFLGVPWSDEDEAYAKRRDEP